MLKDGQEAGRPVWKCDGALDNKVEKMERTNGMLGGEGGWEQSSGMKVSSLTNDGRKGIWGERALNTFLYAAIWQLDIKLRARRHRDLVCIYLKLILFQKCLDFVFLFNKNPFDLLGYLSFLSVLCL